MKTKGFFMVLFLSMLLNSLSYPCTVFNATSNGRTLAGNNEDYLFDYAKIRFIPASAGKYGVIYFCHHSMFPEGGMNDQGLFFDVASCPFSQGPVAEGKPPIPWSGDSNLNLEFLQLCSNVEEALELARRYSYPLKMHSQTMFVDKTGASAILGWVNGEFKITRKKGSYQVMTNFSASNPELGGFPCLRHEIATELLKKSDVSVESFRNILSAVHAEGQISTIYSNIYDLNKGVIYVYNQHDFENAVIINLDAELKKGEHVIDFQSIFPRTFVGTLNAKKLDFDSHMVKLIILGLMFFAVLLFSLEGLLAWVIERLFSAKTAAAKISWVSFMANIWMSISAVLGSILVLFMISNIGAIEQAFSLGQKTNWTYFLIVIKWAMVIKWAYAILTAGSIFFILLAWIKHYGSLFYRLLMVLACLALVYLGSIMLKLNLLVFS